MLTKDRYIVKRLFISLIKTIWTVYINAMTRALKIPTSYLQVSSIVLRKVPTKGEQRTEKQSLLEMAYRRHLSEVVDRYELTKKKS